MFDVKHIKGNTYYFEAFTHVGIYQLDERRVVLIDSCDHMRMVRNLDRYLTEKGLVVDTVINTHAHADHVCGNKFFQEKYGCKLLSTEKESTFIKYPHLEMDFYHEGIDCSKKSNPFYMLEPTESQLISTDKLPEGFEIVLLPGHSFEMIGVRTPDNVLFLSDSVVSEDTWNTHKFPFFFHVNTSIETMEKIKSIKADLYLPSHDKLTDSITDLADCNIKMFRERKELIYSLCDYLSFDEIFTLMINELDIKVHTNKYMMYSVMLRKTLQALIEDGRIGNKLEENRFIYFRK